MSAPRWTIALIRRLAASNETETNPAEADVLIGDLEEAHRARVAKRGVVLAALLTTIETVDIALMLMRRRVRLPRSTMSWLDLKLGARLLVRYPVLTVIGSGSLALAIAIGAAAFAFISLILWPRLPLPDGDQIKVVRFYDSHANQPESRVTADFLRWRGGTGTLTEFAAGRGMARNLMMGDGIVEPATVAEVTSSMFAMTRVAPILGRTLTDADASAAAPPVIVIGERIWRERFGADSSLVGKQVRVSDVPTTVVGVMPAAYRFPSIYEAWQPLKIDDTAAKPRAGMGIKVWARLKPGVSPEQANAELAVLSAQAAAIWPATHAHLTVDVQPPTSPGVRDPQERQLLASANLVIVLLVLLVSGNVALLMFARAATRESEIVVRTALGATRGRLVGQFLAEALTLNAIAAIIGLALGQRVMAWGVNTFTLAANDGELLPFWITSTLPPISFAYGIGLALFATMVTGILPALKMTKAVSSRLRETTGGGGLKFGGVWTVLIVTQIAVTVFFPATTFLAKRMSWQLEDQQIGVPLERYLSAKLQSASDMSQARFETAVRRVRNDLAALPGVASVSVADKLPLMWNGHYIIDMDPGGEAPTDKTYVNAHRISTAAVEPDFFSTFDAAPIAGRLLTPGDYAGTTQVVVVNQSFVEKVLGGRNAIGRHIRYQSGSRDGQLPPEQQWIEIVGVVRDLGMHVDPTSPTTAGVYMPLELRAVNSVMIAARVTGDMTASTNALRSIAAKADPAMRISEVQPLSLITANTLTTINYVARSLSLVSFAALVLALSGIYAVMSFTVSRRTREIGIRVALGSQRSRVVLAILRRPLIQLTAGIVFGALLTFAFGSMFGVTLGFSLGLLAYGLVMLGVCLLACVVPARRALRVDPIAALRME